MIYTLTDKTTGYEYITNNPTDVASILEVTSKFVETLEDGDIFHILNYRIKVSTDAVDIKKLKNQNLWRD